MDFLSILKRSSENTSLLASIAPLQPRHPSTPRCTTPPAAPHPIYLDWTNTQMAQSKSSTKDARLFKYFMLKNEKPRSIKSHNESLSIMVDHIIQTYTNKRVLRYAAFRCTTLRELKRNDYKKNGWKTRRWLERKKKSVLLRLEISRESYLSQLSCSHMELVQTWHLREGTTESCQFRWSQVV